jgi:hypothetical protein
VSWKPVESHPSMSSQSLLTHGTGRAPVCPPTVARYILRLRFSDAEDQRVLDLVRRHTGTGLTATEMAEMDAYLKAADMLSILWSKARMALKRKETARVKQPAA